MKDDFIANRITELRLDKGLSEYKLSFEIGRSNTYIGMITSQRATPSMTTFLALCDYFEITPEQFFYPKLTDDARKVVESLSNLTDEDMKALLHIIESFQAKNRLCEK